MSRFRYGPRNMLLELLMIAVAIIFAFPGYILVVLSLKPPSEIAASPLSLPQSLYLTNYQEAWSSASLGSAIVSSTIITVWSVLLLVILGSLAAYVLVRRQQRLSYGLYLLFLLGLFLPFQLALVPLYAIMNDIGLLGSYYSVIIFSTGYHLPLTIFLYTGFLRALPRDYENAALVDGASHFQAFTRVVFPLLRPVTGTVIILTAVFTWNDFLVPLLYLSGSGNETIPVVVYSFVGQYVAQWGLVFAGLLIGIAPILVLYLVLQRPMIKGFGGGLKG